MDNPWATESPPKYHPPDPEPELETTDSIVASDGPEDDWNAAWGATDEPQHPDQWETARQDKEKLNRVVPPELLDSLLRHCQHVSQEIWPTSETDNDDSWKSGFDPHADIAALLAQLIPVDLTLPPTVQFSSTATANAMNEALKLTRHLPASANSPLSRLLASKGSLEWENSIKVKQDTVPDIAHVGWRVLEKQDRLATFDESKQKKATGGLLSFWNRRASAIQPVPVEAPSERSSSPARSSLESVKSGSHPPASRAVSPPKAATPSVAPLPPTDSAVAVTTLPPSAVSRFLNRFARGKGTQNNSLALSSDDLEFLSDIVPSASDPPDEDINGSALDVLTSANNSSPFSPKLPPPIPPPPMRPILSSRPSSALGLGILDGVSVTANVPPAFQMQTANQIPVLAPPLSPQTATSVSHTQIPPLSLTATPTVASGQSSTPSILQRLQPTSQPNSRPHSPFTLPPPQKMPSSLSIPPLLPPPPVSPPPTPLPGTSPSVAKPGHSSVMWNTDTTPFHDPCDDDDEFSAFTSFPPSAPAPFPSSEPYPSRGPPSPPSPPPRRTYERTHYPSSSTTSILSPASQTSQDQLYSTRSSISVSLDSFDDFVSPPSIVRGGHRKRTPSPPPLPVKPQFERQQPLRLDTLSSHAYHAHTPSQTFPSPTVRTSLMSSAFSVPDAEHQRTQSLVNHAAARGGMWPNSPDWNEPSVRAIPPPPSTSTSPKPLMGEEGFDLLGGDFSGSLEALPPLNAVGDTGMGSTVSPPAMAALRAPFGVGGPGKELGLRNQPRPLPSTSTPILSFASLNTPVPLAAPNPGSSHPTKPKQTGGLSAQDLSFFEGL